MKSDLPLLVLTAPASLFFAADPGWPPAHQDAIDFTAREPDPASASR